jgi:hypothetical protein
MKESSNYFRYNDERLCMTMDLGNLSSNYLMAHSHNDINNFELLVDNKKIIIDTGVYEYESGIERYYSRSTLAHNTVQINGLEQSDIWGSFRNGYRPTKFSVELEKKNSYDRFTGIYKYKKIYIHKRDFLITKNSTVIIFDNVITKKKLSLKSSLHFAPEVNVFMNKKNIEIIADNLKLYLYIFDNGANDNIQDFKIINTDYFPYFETKILRKTLILESEKSPLGYIISLSKIDKIHFDGSKLRLKYENGNFEDLEGLK